MLNRRPFRRTDRVADLIRRELANLVQTGLKDPRVGFVSITGVEVSPDLKQAKVHVSVYGTPEEQVSSLEGLQSATGYVRSVLKRTLHLKRIPELVFYLDDSIAQGARINAALASLKD